MNSNSISRLFGRFASHAFPPFFQRIVNRVYVRIFRIDLSEFAPIDSYPMLNALFTRALQKPRAIDSSATVLISPSDSMITAQGAIANDTALQIKGMSYSPNELLGIDKSAPNQASLERFSFINLYLSPSDYHRYHAPCDMEILEARYFGGELLPVNLPSLNKNQNLFVRNERVVLVAKMLESNDVDSGRADSGRQDSKSQNTKSADKLLYFVAVGALNVGQMIFHFEPRIKTNATPNAKQIYRYDAPIRIRKGEELGHFQMGSTIVLIAPLSKLTTELGQKVRFGEKIADI
ncbi:phosphatidylserine decarboxylase [Helicobacter sp. CLO-3]|uniref:archaetidylserine decarboxylase n=1 Tax=unclassified Helicobacter TaxID=2593540 RepID=UPI000805A8E5|nr:MULTISPECIES: archaetidylserine decarboxylase [unclassified Helicobacter]OBV29770.1 phosphatidylserine decarboxylase [Helicobacter sp. CLO-3]OHU85223.1 phosphatidylserine decarboxylase [Helicobacter sp. CLO-3]